MDNTPQKSAERARVKRPERRQIQWREFSLDQLVPSDHQVRSVWAYVDSLDFDPVYSKIRAVEGHVGRDAVDPKILMSLWMFATIEGVSSARQVARLCQRDVAYMWICGGVGVNYHLLSDFRTAHGDFLDQLLTDTIATLIHQGLVTLEVVAQDGMRVRAHAGSSSFRREKTLKKCHEQARQRVEQMREENRQESQRDASTQRRKAAQERAVREREQRVEKALEELAELQKQKEGRKKGAGKEARCSTTDPEARKMKMGDGGFRPAYNVQLASDGRARMIIGVGVTNSGSDRGQMASMHSQVSERYDKQPEQYLVDNGFAINEDITTLEKKGTAVLAPIRREQQMKRAGRDPYARQPKDTDQVYQFRRRMKSEQAKTTYKQRPSIAEFPNAECRNRGLTQFPVRGLAKVRAVSLLHAITFNFMRMTHLGCLK